MNKKFIIIVIIILIILIVTRINKVIEPYTFTQDNITYYIDENDTYVKSQVIEEDYISSETIYYPNTKSDKEPNPEIQYFYNNDETINYAYFYDESGTITSIVEYKADTNIENIEQNIFRVYELNEDETIKSAIEYDEYNNVAITYEFYPGAIYNKNHKESVSKYIEDFYTSDGVITGTTTKTFKEDGSVDTINAETNVTYYTQNEETLKDIPCPGWWENMQKNGCMVVSYSMMYSAFSDEELTPEEIYEQGYSCDLFPTYDELSAQNGMQSAEIAVHSNGTTQDVVFYNSDNIVPNNKETFTLVEAIVNYGMPVQLWTDAEGWNEHIIETGHHSVVAYKYTYEDGKGTVYVHDPYLGGEGITLESYLAGANYATSGNFTITSAWVVNKP